MLIGGFGIGQGSIFLAQTYLVATGRTELLALFGTHFSVAMLGIIAVEAGSLTILSAQIARLVVAEESRQLLWRSYWETTIYRVTVAVLVVVGLLIFREIVTLPDFSEYYLIGALPAMLIWAFNGAGFLDGLQKSGISGLTGSIAYVASAIGLVMAVGGSNADAGLLTGAALSIGYGLTVVIQFGALAFLGWRPRYVTPSVAGIRTAFVEEGSMLAGLLPGQLYFRAQLGIAAAFLGPTPTAMLVYAKQIIGAASQIAGFARRIEFPRMVQAVHSNPSIAPMPLVLIQKISFAVAVMAVVSIAIASAVIVSISSGFAAQAWTFLALFSVTILTESVGQSLVQALFARNRYHGPAFARVVAVIVAIAFAYVFVQMAGTHVFILSDLVSHAIVISFAFWLLIRSAAADVRPAT
jgi:hypothetical protein